MIYKLKGIYGVGGGSVGGGWGGVSPCGMLNLCKTPVVCRIQEPPCHPVEFKNHPCRMSLSSLKKGKLTQCVLRCGVYTPLGTHT